MAGIKVGLIAGALVVAMVVAARRGPIDAWTPRARWTMGTLVTLALTEIVLTVWSILHPPLPIPLTSRESVEPIARFPIPPDLDARPQPGKTVLFVGDSFVVGKAVDEDETFVAKVRDALGDDVRVLNHGRSGRSLPDEAVMYAALGQPVAPDVVVWVFYPNDFGAFGTPPLDFAGAGALEAIEPLPWQPPLYLLSGLRKRQLTTATEETTIATLADPPRLALLGDVLGQVHQGLAARGGELVVVVLPVLHELDVYPFAEGHRLLLEVARASGATVVDPLPRLADFPTEQLWADPADHHLSPVGHDVVADLILKDLEGMADAADTPSCDHVPVLPGMGDAMRRACMAATPADLLDAAEALNAASPETDVPYNALLVALDVASVSVLRDPSLQTRAEGLMPRR